MPPHDAANGSVPRSSRDRARATRGLAILTALALTTGCAAATAPTAPRAVDEAAARAAAQAAARTASGFVGVYAARLEEKAGPDPTGAGGTRAVTLELRVDGTAQLEVVQLGRGVEVRPGRWGASGEELRVEWDTPDASGALPATTAWLRAGDRLVPSQWDPASWGQAGLGLARWHPSRAPRAGCHWQPFADAILAVRLLVEACGSDGPHFAARGAEIVHLDDPEGQALRALRRDTASAARGTPIVQVFAKKPRQPLGDAIRQRFFPQLVPRVRKGCVVRRGGGVDLGDPAKETWTIAPTDKYRGETEKWRAAEPSAMVCGPYGLRDGVGYFEFHPKASPSRYLFVWLGREAPRFDERSIELLD
jgi:hypothetical protein